MARNPIVLIHGYSDDGASFKVWERILGQRGYDVAMIHACSYRSLTNEVTIKDIAEGFDRALRIQNFFASRMSGFHNNHHAIDARTQHGGIR